MIALEHALRTALLHFVWQGAVIAFVLWIALLMMRRRSANARYIASCLALGALVAAPVVTGYMSYTQPVTSEARSGHSLSTVPDTVAAVWTGSTTHAPTWLASLGWWALPAWAFGVALFSIRLAWGSRQVAVLRRSGKPADSGVLALANDLQVRMKLSSPVRLLVSAFAEGPSVVGWIRPVILLPATTLLGLSPEQLESVLAHEFAHIRRYDYLVNILQMLVESLLFYHPAVWWTSARIRHERELCCDDLAVAACGDPLCYARALTKLERLRTFAPNMAMGSTDGPLMYRIQRLTGAATRKFGPSRLPGVLAICLGVICLTLGLNWSRLRAQDVRAKEKPAVVAGPAWRRADAPGVKVELDGATVLDRVPVEYPRSAIDDDIEGRVRVEARIDASGKVQEVRALSGPDELRDAVMASVRKWSFKPDSSQNTVEISVGFQLPKADADSDDDDDMDVDVEMDNDVDVDVNVDVNVDVEVPDIDIEIPEVEVSIPENVMADVETSLQEAESAIEEAESELSDKLADLPSQLDEAKHALERLGKIEDHVNLVDGRTLKRIRILGLSEESRTKLVKALPVHEGDKITKTAIEKMGKAVHDFDAKLDCMVVPNENGDATIVIGKK
jgi:TonB family protein